MKGRILTKETITGFINHLHLEEKSTNTIEKYARDVKAFAAYLNGNVVSKELVIEYKQKLIADGYAVSSINSMLAAVNSLFDYLEWVDCKVKAIKIQRQIYCPENKKLSKAEYLTEPQILAFLDYVSETAFEDVNKKRAIINNFVNCVYLYPLSHHRRRSDVSPKRRFMPRRGTPHG